jgi:hypothetical protein
MKINNWCRKLSSTLVAGGLLLPCAAHAANLGVNLVTNGDFENVDVNTTGAYGGPLVLNWTGPNLFAYSHDASVTSTSGPGGVPDYAEGADPPAAGHWYFTPNNTGLADPTDVHDPDTYYQDIDVSTGATGTTIAAGLAAYDLRAYMTSYLNDTDVAHVRADFRNGGGTSLGMAQIDDSDPGPDNVWNLNVGSGPVPVGTATVRISLWGTRTAGGAGADGYMDNVSFVITAIPEPTSGALAGLGVLAAGMGLRRRREGC